MSPVRRPRLAALVVATALLAGAGCSEAAGPTQEEYTAAADRVCTAGKDELEDLQEEHASELWEAGAGGESSTYVDRPDRWVRAKVVPAYEGMANSLRGLPAPDGDASYLTDLYADLDAHIREIHLYPSAEDGAALRTPDPLLTERFASYGMEICGTF